MGGRHGPESAIITEGEILSYSLPCKELHPDYLTFADVQQTQDPEDDDEIYPPVQGTRPEGGRLPGVRTEQTEAR